jgi:integrase
MVDRFESSLGHFITNCLLVGLAKPEIHVALFVALVFSAFGFSMAEKKKFPYSDPVLVDYQGNTAKRWFIKFYVWDIGLGKKVRSRWAEGLNKSKDPKERYRIASIALDMIKKELRAGNVKNSKPKPEKKGVEDLTLPDAMRYVLERKPDLSKHWKKSHLHVIGLVEKYFFKRANPSFTKLKMVDYDSIMNFITKELGCGPKTLNEYAGIIGSTLNYMVKMELITRNYIADLPKRKVPKGESNIPFTLEEVKRLFEAAEADKNPQWVIYVKFILYTLGRTGKEIRMLKVKDIRPTTIFIPKDRGKTGGRSIDIAPHLEKLVQENNIRSYPSDWFVFGADGIPGPKVQFRDHFYRFFRKYLVKCGMAEAGHTLYAFKHTGAIQAVIAGVDILAIQNMCGHEDLKTTQKYLINIGAIRTTGNELSKLPVY